MGKMSTLVFSHENRFSYQKKGVKTKIVEDIKDGDKGLSFYFMKKVGETFFSLSVRQHEKGAFKVIEKNGDKVDEKEASEADIKKMLKGNKKLDSEEGNFGDIVLNYLSKDRKKYSAKGGKKYKKKSKKSKKKSKKSSKKKKSKKSSKKKKSKSKKSSKKSKKKKSKKFSKKKKSKKSSKKSKK